MSDYLKHLHGAETAHYLRYCRSAEWIAPLMRAEKPETIVCEFGGGSPFQDLVRECWPACQLIYTDPCDLREPLPRDHGDQWADLVLCMEVLEHIKDRERDDRATFTSGGIRNMLAEAFRILRPGGRLFLTTPNLACWYSIHLLLCKQHPYFFQLHNRELTAHEVNAFLIEAGFTIERQESIDVWGQHGLTADRIERLDYALTTLGYDVGGREDCLFTLARKP